MKLRNNRNNLEIDGLGDVDRDRTQILRPRQEDDRIGWSVFNVYHRWLWVIISVEIPARVPRLLLPRLPHSVHKGL